MPTAVTDNSSAPPDDPRPRTRADLRTARLIAAVTGLVGFVLAVLTPLLPVSQTTVDLNWPQNGSLEAVNAPATSYQPISLDATIPCSAITDVVDQGPGAHDVLSTAPGSAGPDAHKRAMFVTVNDNQVQVRTRNSLVAQAPTDAVTAPGACSGIHITSDAEHTAAEFVGLTNADGAPLAGSVDGDKRPQLVGVYTDMTGGVPDGLQFSAEIDSRWSTTPTLLKGLAMIFAVALTITSLVALSRFDATDGRRNRRFLPARWWHFDLKDGLVISVLVLWHFIGANTADDGYIMTMARAAEHSGYMSNYYRWFAAPEAPFGMSYYIFTGLSHISTASPLLRLPALIAGILCWMVISREVIPRLGRLARRRNLVLWTSGLVFLAFWLPFNNGLRPEPYIALGALLTWCSVERAIATRRVMPIVGALLIASFTLSVGPTGTICVAALIAGSRPMLQIIIRRAKQMGWLATIGPLLASGTIVLVLVFGDTTLRSVLQATNMKTDIGPSEEWYMEYLRYEALMTFSPDGSIARRFAVFTMILGLLTCAAVIYRKRGIPGVALGPSRRIVGIGAMSLALMMFNPTKWSHHFGVYAGLAGALAALTTLAILSSSLRSGRNRALFAAALMFVMAISFESTNSWWYVSNYGVPWGGKKPELEGIGAAQVFILLTLVALLVALYLHYREPYIRAAIDRGEQPPSRRFLGGRLDGIIAAPLTVVAGFMVLVEVLTMLAAMAIQYPAYSVGKGNLKALAGEPCAQSEQILVEPDANAGMLTPVGAEPAEALGATLNENFAANDIPTDLSSDKEYVQPGVVGTGEDSDTRSNSAGTGGGLIDEAGANGSLAQLPFGLDPATTPILGSFHTESQPTSHAVSAWYRLPERATDQLLVISAAGRVNPGNLHVIFGHEADGDVQPVGTGQGLFDTGPSPSWRNLRLPTDKAPAEANVVQIVAYDDNPELSQWIAFTPPRIAQTETLQAYVGSDAPVLLDWAVSLAFPCQRPFDHLNGIAEIPKFRILPDRGLAVSSTNTWQDAKGGGPLGWTDLLLQGETVPSYQKNDWGRDWGSLVEFNLRVPDSTEAQLDLGTATRSGLWTPGPIRH